MVVAYYLSKDSEISKYIKYLNLVFLRKKNNGQFHQISVLVSVLKILCPLSSSFTAIRTDSNFSNKHWALM